MTTMKAAVIYEAGGPEVLRMETRPVPVPQPGEVLIGLRPSVSTARSSLPGRGCRRT